MYNLSQKPCSITFTLATVHSAKRLICQAPEAAEILHAMHVSANIPFQDQIFDKRVGEAYDEMQTLFRYF